MVLLHLYTDIKDFDFHFHVLALGLIFLGDVCNRGFNREFVCFFPNRKEETDERDKITIDSLTFIDQPKNRDVFYFP